MGKGVTEPSGAELARAEHADFQLIVETIPEVFYLTDAERRMLYVSPAFESLWGHSPDRLFGDRSAWLDLVHPDDRQSVADALARNIGKGQYEIEYRFIRADGATRWVSSRSTEICNPDGSLHRVVGVATDITQRKELELQLRHSQKMEAVGQLASGVAHDFNNLLTIIKGNAAALHHALDPSDTHVARAIEIEEAATSAAALTKKLLGFSRRSVLSLKPVDLREIVRELVALLRRTLDPRIQVEVEQPEVLNSVLADATELSQVLLNLCLNARDAMPDGGRLAISMGRARVDHHRTEHTADGATGDLVFLSVADSGHGIPADILSRIFEPFFTTKPEGQGTGLGLAIAFGVVKQHGGWIECTTSVGAGAKFTVYLPVGAGEHGECESSPYQARAK
jgi:PAS domain S-box-containing protein